MRLLSDARNEQCMIILLLEKDRLTSINRDTMTLRVATRLSIPWSYAAYLSLFCLSRSHLATVWYTALGKQSWNMAASLSIRCVIDRWSGATARLVATS